MLNNYEPHNWVIIKIFGDGEHPYCKILAGWEEESRRLTQGRWQMNSGITHFEETDQAYLFFGVSGSCYVCKKGEYGLSVVTAPIWQQLHDTYGDQVELLGEKTCISDLTFSV